MTIFTSYYANLKNLEKNGVIPFAISVILPAWYPVKYKIYAYQKLAPRFDMLKLDEKQYRDEFNRILSRLDPETVLNDLQTISKGLPIALLCYEKPGEFCHRHIVAEWLSYYIADLEIREFDHPKPKPKDNTLSLF